MDILISLCIVGALVIHSLIAIYDFAYFRIPNLLVAGLFVLFFFWAALTMDWSDLANHLMVFVGMLILSFSLFSFGWIGGGDAKYLAVGALWVGLHYLVAYILWVAIAGGVLSIFYMTTKQMMATLSDRMWSALQKTESALKPLKCIWYMSGEGSQEGPQRAIAERSVPYGVAIAVGSWLILLGKI